MQLEFKTGHGVAAAIPGSVAAPLERHLDLRQKDTILLVEEQPAIRGHLTSCLEALGYTVLPSRDGKAALARLREYKARIDLLLTDFSMPEISGTELARFAAADRPGIKVLYMSAYPEEFVWEADFFKGKPLWLAKPFTPQLLAAAVRKALGSRRRTVLIVDESEEVRAFLAAALRTGGCEVLDASSLLGARAVLSETRVDLIIGDLARFRYGKESVRSLRRLYPATKVLVMTGSSHAFTKDLFCAARQGRPMEADDLMARWLLGADAAVPKPISADRLLETVGKLLEG